MAVHHVQVEHAGAAPLDAADLLGQAPKVGREKGGNDFNHLRIFLILSQRRRSRLRRRAPAGVVQSARSAPKPPPPQPRNSPPARASRSNKPAPRPAPAARAHGPAAPLAGGA